MLGFSFFFRFRSRLLRLPGFVTACWRLHCNSLDVISDVVWSCMFFSFENRLRGANVMKVRLDAAHNMGGLTHVQTLSVTDGSDLRVPSSHSTRQCSGSFI